MISEENIIDNRVRGQRAKTKDSAMPEIWLNNSIVEATLRVVMKSYADAAKNVKATPSPKV